MSHREGNIVSIHMLGDVHRGCMLVAFLAVFFSFVGVIFTAQLYLSLPSTYIPGKLQFRIS